jgi:cytoskeletal protein CcmA (bactofilin family)
MPGENEANLNGVPMENQRISDRIAEPEQKSSFSKTTCITGEISGHGDLSLAGQYNGNINLKGVLFIGKECRFSGQITAEHIIIEGSAEGKIKALDKIEIRSSGHVQGRIVCQKIAIAEGAYLDGEVKSKKGNTLEPSFFVEKRKELLPNDK